jgi:hypothetical protein
MMKPINPPGVAPIALFVYGRPWHTRQTVESLQQNGLARQSDLFIFSDAPKRPEAFDAVRQVREYINTINGFRSVQLIVRRHNLGLSRSIIAGTTDLLDKFGKVIVLEDDLVTSSHFLAYMNDALERFAEEDRVISIHGYVYPTGRVLPEAFFLRGADCWGWATWKRGWQLFNPDGRALLNQIRGRKLTRLFDFGCSYPYVQMLENQILGKNDSWAVRWYASAFLADKLTLYPGKSLVHNIGNDNSGTHCGASRNMDACLCDSPVDLSQLNVEESTEARLAFEEYFRKNHSGLAGRVLRKIRHIAAIRAS